MQGNGDKNNVKHLHGEKTIGFYNRNTREIMYPELVKSDSDVEAFYEKYGLKK